jgi:hypothetical protein
MNRRQRRHKENFERRLREERRIFALEETVAFMRARNPPNTCLCGTKKTWGRLLKSPSDKFTENSWKLVANCLECGPVEFELELTQDWLTVEADIKAEKAAAK